MENPAQRSFVSYIDKSREYYANEGFEVPYKWAKHADAPFQPLSKPLNECKVALVTTTKPTEDAPLRPFDAPIDPLPTDMFTDHLFWHKGATNTADLGSFLPIEHVQALVAQGVVGELNHRFFGAPTVYSQRRTQSNAEEIAQWCADDDVDLVLLCPL